MKTSLSNQKGFSLTELIVVLCIITIFAGMSVAAFPMIDGMRFKTESVKLGNALVLARNLAMTRGRCVMVHIDKAARTLDITSYALPSTMKCQASLLSPQTVATISFEKFISLNDFDNGLPLIFGPRGSTTRSEIANVSISHTLSTASTTFMVMPATGKVSSR